jgi:hypothetical protein
MRHPVRLLLLLLAAVAVTVGVAACGDDGAIPDPGPATTPDPAEENAYELTVRSSRGATAAIRASLCGEPSSQLVELPCGLSLAFARASAPRLYVGRTRDRIFLELNRPATAVFTSLGEGVGEHDLQRGSALQKLDGKGKNFSIGYGPTTSDLPTVVEPTYLSVLVLFDGEMPVPTPAASGVPDDAVVRDAAAEYLVQLATRTKADDES